MVRNSNLVLTWFAILQKIILEPRVFFATLPKEKRIKNSLIFAVAIWVISNIFRSIIIIKLYPEVANKFKEFGMPEIILSIVMLVTIGAALFALGIFISAKIFHFFVSKYHENAEFADTFSILAYSWAITIFSIFYALFVKNLALFYLLAIIMGAWQIYIIYIGFLTACGLNKKNALKTTLIPVGILLSLYLILVIIASWFSKNENPDSIQQSQEAIIGDELYVPK